MNKQIKTVSTGFLFISALIVGVIWLGIQPKPEPSEATQSTDGYINVNNQIQSLQNTISLMRQLAEDMENPKPNQNNQGESTTGPIVKHMGTIEQYRNSERDIAASMTSGLQSTTSGGAKFASERGRKITDQMLHKRLSKR